MLKSLTMDHNKLWKILRDGNTRPPYLSPEKPVWSNKKHRAGHGKTDWFKIGKVLFSSVQLSRSVESDSLWPHELQHARPPCPSPTPGVHSNSCSTSWWCHPAISSSVIPFSSCLQSFPASGSFTMSSLLTLGGQSIGVSASASVLPMNILYWFSFRIDYLDLLAV